MTLAPAPDPSLGPGPWGVYVHVPWCRRRCPYCSFYVQVDRGPDHVAFTDAVLRGLERQRGPFDALGPPATLSFGGGTPSRLPPDQVRRIAEAVGLPAGSEISLEANPEDLEPDVLQGLRAAGVTRLSVGLQTFQPRLARLLNRASSVEQARQALERVANAGFDSFSVDLIFGLPAQDLEELDRDLSALIEADPAHVSLYGLTYEPGTPFARARDKGRFEELPEELWRAMSERIHERLGQAGLHRYEISNYARPGHESRHNQLYWGDRPYLGLGPSAHSYGPDGSRWHDVADLAAWLDRPDPSEPVERPDPWQTATDLLVSGLRGREGLSRARLRRRTGLDVHPALLRDLHGVGLLQIQGDQIALTDEGVAVADGIVERLSDRLVPVPLPAG